MDDQGNPQINRYFRLMEVVGTTGKYQNIVLLLFCVLVFVVGSLSLGNPYYFAVAPYTNCPEPYSTATQCNNYVCSLPISERSQYLEPQISQLHTLGNSFGDYHCQKSDIISTAMGMFFLGSIFGYICVGSLVDNCGRKLTFNLCLIIGCLGNFLVIVSPNLVLAEIGLFLMGFGLENAFNLCFYFFSEQFQDSKRQVGGVIIQSCFCIGGISTILWFFLFKNWKIIFWLCYFIPLCVFTVISLIYLKQTPQFLIKRKPVQEIRKEFQFIANLNNRTSQFENSQYTTLQSLQALKDEYTSQSEASHKTIFTFRDLFKYRSLRYMTLLVGTVCFAVDFLYYAPLMLIDQFGFDFYANGLIINFSELITYAISFFYITKIKRKTLALYLFSLSFACSFALLFLHRHVICQENCWNARMVFELIIVFILRFACALQFQVLLIYINELYPIQIVGIGASFSSITGTLPNVFIPELINLCNRYNLNIMIFFCIICILGLVSSKFLRETRGCTLRERIEEFGLKDEDQKPEIELVEETS